MYYGCTFLLYAVSQCGHSSTPIVELMEVEGERICTGNQSVLDISSFQVETNRANTPRRVWFCDWLQVGVVANTHESHPMTTNLKFTVSF